MNISNYIKKIFINSLVIFSLTSCATLKISKYVLDDNKFYDNQESYLRILQISDFHSNDFGEKEVLLIDKISNENPDLIVITGDLFEASFEKNKIYSNVEFLLEGIYKLCPIYFVTGNHEYAFESLEDIIKLLSKYNVNILDDETMLLEFIQGKIIISGVNDPYKLQKEQIQKLNDGQEANYSYKEKYIEILQKVSAKKDELNKFNEDILFNLLLAHRPEYIQDYLKFDYDLTLSGHAHGGQWRFPPFINGLYAPGQGLFPKYAGGKYNFENGKVFIVCRGLSYQQPKFPRIFNNPEIVVIDIYPKKISN